MIRININAESLRELRQGVFLASRRARKKTGDKIFDLLYAAADKHTRASRPADRYSPGVIGGALIRSLKQKVTFATGSYGIYHDLRIAPHAIFVHWGTRAHPIPKPGRPMRKKALRFPVGGAFAFAKSVNHPGYRGDPYFVTIATPQRIKGIFDAFLTAELPR